MKRGQLAVGSSGSGTGQRPGGEAAGMKGSLRWRILAVLILMGLIPALLLGAVGATTTRRLSALAREHAKTALAEEGQQRLIGRVVERARTDDAVFTAVRDQAVTLARFVAWFYDNPQNIPEPGYLKGGSTLEFTPYRHLVNLPTTPVGVFLSRRAVISDAVWREVGVLSFADPLLVAARRSTPGADRVWLTSATRIVRIFPNVRLGHEGSRVGPDYDLTEDEPFQAAAPGRNPGRQPVWTTPYLDPVTGDLMMTAAAPIYSNDGGFRGVVGIDVPLNTVLAGTLQATPEPDRYFFLVDRQGGIVSAPEAAWSDLALPAAGTDNRAGTNQGAATATATSPPTPGATQPGRRVVVPLSSSSHQEVRGLGTLLPGTTAAGLTTLNTAGGPRYLAYAPLPSTDWVLAMAAPAEQVEAASVQVQANISGLEDQFLFGGAAGLIAIVLLALLLAARAAAALARPVATLVEGTRRLAANLSYRLPNLGTDELGHLAAAFNTMAASIARSRDEAVRSARMVMEERSRLAREIHDTIAQGLTGVVVQLETAEDCLGDQDSAAALGHLQRARALARESLKEARRSVWNLRPAAVAEGGLPAALSGLAADLGQSGIECRLQLPADSALPEAVTDVLFRVCQEALANVRQHSGGRQARVFLAVVDGEAVLEVADDGQGFDPARRTGPHPTGGFGLWAMQGRLETVGGTLTVTSDPGAGTVVKARVPVPGPGI